MWRDVHAVLNGAPAAADRFQAQRRSELGGRRGADARRQEEPEDDVNQDEAGEPAGRAQPTNYAAKRLFVSAFWTLRAQAEATAVKKFLETVRSAAPNSSFSCSTRG